MNVFPVARRDFLRRFSLLLLGVLLAVLTQTAAAQDALKERMVGLWDELGGKQNLVSFDKNGSWKLYLEKGEVGELKTLGGSWSLAEGGKLEMSVEVEEKKKVFNSIVHFEGEEMVLTEEGGKSTRHRRHEGPIPDRFKW